MKFTLTASAKCHSWWSERVCTHRLSTRLIYGLTISNSCWRRYRARFLPTRGGHTLFWCDTTRLVESLWVDSWSPIVSNSIVYELEDVACSLRYLISRLTYNYLTLFVINYYYNFFLNLFYCFRRHRLRLPIIVMKLQRAGRSLVSR